MQTAGSAKLTSRVGRCWQQVGYTLSVTGFMSCTPCKKLFQVMLLQYVTYSLWLLVSLMLAAVSSSAFRPQLCPMLFWQVP